MVAIRDAILFAGDSAYRDDLSAAKNHCFSAASGGAGDGVGVIIISKEGVSVNDRYLRR